MRLIGLLIYKSLLPKYFYWFFAAHTTEKKPGGKKRGNPRLVNFFIIAHCDSETFLSENNKPSAHRGFAKRA
ncbi:hypothetical protein CKA38_12040 [Ereboglobus luteus]|uniref:Uncharacterized protein n=1 Tax=Ereboglobus luteus TaxID=1796921 RepID=A0A2U8E5S9_9BACT|nr:hypothetical protein CKA38_12040 [Ereboglobus luteus]